MRIAIACVALVACSSPSHRVYVTIDDDAVATARELAARDRASLDVIEAGRDSAILAIDDAELDALSHEMHARFGRCGGFMAHDSLADARTPPRDQRDRPLDYTIDRGDAVRAVLPQLAAAHIADTIRQLSAMPTRHYMTDSGAQASIWLRDRWRGFAAAANRADVSVELFDQGYPQKSVILTIPGTSRASEVVVIGGHLDSISMAGRGARAPGADDDASGIATLDEVLRALLAADYRPERTLKFMAYAAEEVGLRGSLAIVKDFQKRKVNVVGALQLDMTNYQGSAVDIWIIDDHTSKAQNDFLVKLIDTYVGASYAHDRCGYACSDHASWHRAGVPASMPFESSARDRNQKIHTARDTLELSNDNADHAVKFARLGAAYAIELAKGSLGGARLTTAESPPSHRSWWLAAVALVVALGVMAGRRGRRAR